MTTTTFTAHIENIIGEQITLTGTISAFQDRHTGDFEEYEITDLTLTYPCGEKIRLSTIKSMVAGLYAKGTMKDIDEAAQAAWIEARSEEMAEI